MIRIKPKRLNDYQKQYLEEHKNDPITGEDIFYVILFIIMMIAFIVDMIYSFVTGEVTSKVNGTCFIIILFCGGLLVDMTENIGYK